MKKINVCVFPAQNESAVEINNALSVCEGINVFGVTSVRGHGEYNFTNYCYDMVDIDDELFTYRFEEYLQKNSIDVIFPTSDSTVEYFARNKDKFSAVVTTPDLFTAETLNDKFKTYKLFKDCDFCPKLYKNTFEYPCFIKPFDGEGARGVKIIDSFEDFPDDFTVNQFVVTEYLPGKEMTVDCLTDKDGKLVVVLPRVRKKIFAGMSVLGETIEASEEIIAIAEELNKRLCFKGLWFFQIKQDKYGKYKLLEISMRCAGTMCQSRASGYNLPLLTVYTILGESISCIENNFEVIIDRTLFARYRLNISYDVVYIDYDGTIIVKNKVCLQTIRFLYQSKNSGKKLILVSRHNEDHDDSLQESMQKFGISETLFDDIINLSFNEDKCDVINEKEAIFIDNSFFERLKVAQKKHIPVFGVDGLDALQDWRQ